MRAALAGALALAAVGLSGCLIIDGQGHQVTHTVVVDDGPPPNGELEAVYAAAFAGDQALVRVTSNGCTTKDSFEARVVRGEGDPVVTLRRVRPDLCRAYLADGIELRWTYAELGLASGEKVEIGNPFLLR